MFSLWSEWVRIKDDAYVSLSVRHDVGQGNVNVLQQLQSDRRSGASNKRFLNRLIELYLNNMTNKFAKYDTMPYNMAIVS